MSVDTLSTSWNASLQNHRGLKLVTIVHVVKPNFIRIMYRQPYSILYKSSRTLGYNNQML